MIQIEKQARYIGTKYSVQIDSLYFEWDKLISTLENDFPDIVKEILNHDHQRYALVHSQAYSIPASSSKLNINFWCGITGREWTHRAPSPRFPQPKTRGWAECFGNFCYSSPEIPYNCHDNGQITNPIYYTVHSSRDAPFTSIVRPASVPCNHYGLANRRALQWEHVIESNFPHDYHHQHIHNPSITLNCQETAPIEQWRHVINEVSLLASIMVEQSIIQAVISSVEMFDDTKSKFESQIASLENVAQISGQDILNIAFTKMVGSPLTLACRLRVHLPHLTWKDLKSELLRQYSTIPLDSQTTQAFAHMMSYLKCTYIVPENFYQ